MSAVEKAEQFAGVPEDLKAEASWVLWKYEHRDGKPTKVLRQTNGRNASSTNPETWTTFAAAVAAYEAGGFNGIGFVFHPGNPYCGADIDDVTEADARRWIERFDSYAERSPSGNGIHIICRAEVPQGTNRAEGELYNSGRFFTMTGDVVYAAPIREAQDAADEFYGFLRRGDKVPVERRPAGVSSLTDAEVVSLAEGARNGREFANVYRGGGEFKSGSERDLSLASRLAFWTQDEAQIERLMRASGCAREKWNQHRTYLRDTIRKALDGLTETYTPVAERIPVTLGGRRQGAAGRAAKAAEDRAGEDPPTNGTADVIELSFGGRGGSGARAAFNRTDLGNAERFLRDHGEGVRYCYPWGKWIVWTGARWERDEGGLVHRLGKKTVRGIYGEAANAPDEETRKALAKHATSSEAEPKVRAMLEMAKSDVPVAPDELDADPWLINTPSGTLDLRAGTLRRHRREDLITKMAGPEYDPDARAPAWEAFLERVLPDEELRAFVQRAAGYTATGDTSEQCLFINHGVGANGKSTFQEALFAALGNYALRTPTEMLLTKRAGGVPNDVARLKGARFVAASETEEGRRLAESLVKDLTGQDTISARFMRGEFFDFKPTHKLWLSTNHKPEIRGTDNAIWRRIRLMPWTETIPPDEQDKKLTQKLQDEAPGILAWVAQGCLQWLEGGLRPPEAVRKATGAYRAEMDILAAFLADCCERGENETVQATAIWEAWGRWCEASGEQTGTRKKFVGKLSERGFLNRRDSRTGRKEWAGVSLRSDWEARAGLPLNLSSGRFAGNSENPEPSEPENNISPEKKESRGVMCEKGSEGSEGSAESVSWDLQPGEKATVEELRERCDLPPGDPADLTDLFGPDEGGAP